MEVERYDVLLVDFSGAKGSEQDKIRPAVTVSNSDSCKYSPVIIVMPFTSKQKKVKLPTHHIINNDEGSGLNRESLLIGEQPTPIDRCRILKKLGHISSEKSQKEIDKACYDAFFYNNNTSRRSHDGRI